MESTKIQSALEARKKRIAAETVYSENEKPYNDKITAALEARKKRIESTFPNDSGGNTAANQNPSSADLYGTLNNVGQKDSAVQKEYSGYMSNQNNADFFKHSQYQQTGTATVTDSGETVLSGEDEVYEYINNRNGYRLRFAEKLAEDEDNDGYFPVEYETYTFMQDDEIAVYNYLYHSKGKEAADKFLDFMRTTLNERYREDLENFSVEAADKHPFLSSAYTVFTAPLRAGTWVKQTYDYLDDGKIDQNAPYNYLNHSTSAIRSKVADKIEQSGKWGAVGSFAYQIGMSMGDFLMTTAVSGGNQTMALAIMGCSAAADTTIQAKDRGLSDGQAFALGAIAGAAEIITEKIGLDAFLDKALLEKNMLTYFLKNALGEAIEEPASGLINLLADIYISKDKSEWEMAIKAYENAYGSESMAFWMATLDQAKSLGLDALGGFFSGAALGGGRIAINGAKNVVNSAKSAINNLFHKAGSGDVSTNSVQSENGQASQETEAEPQPGTLEYVQMLNDMGQATGNENQNAGVSQQTAFDIALAQLAANDTVDTHAQTDYDSIKEQGGSINADTQGESVYSSGIWRHTQGNSKGKAAGGTKDGAGDVQFSPQSRNSPAGSRGTVHSTDSEGRALSADQAAKLQGTAIVDSNGAPLAVYHATDNMDFTTFEKGDTGFHFGSSKQAANHSLNRGYSNGRTFRVYLNIKNPVIASCDIMGWHAGGTALRLWADNVLTDSELRDVTALYRMGDGYDSASAIRLREILEEKGYDGIAYPNDFEGAGNSYIAFNNEQIIQSEITPFGTDGNTNLLDGAYDVQTNDAAPQGQSEDSVSDRDFLANAPEGIAANEIEAKRLTEFREQLAKVAELKQKQQELNTQLDELRASKDAKDVEKRRRLQDEAVQTENRLTVLENKLRRMETSAALQSILMREKNSAETLADPGENVTAAVEKDTTVEGGTGVVNFNIDEIRPQLKTQPDIAFFWSGKTDGVGGAEVAADIAKGKGGVTLESTIEANNITMPEWDFNNPSSMDAWDMASAAYAEQVSGEVRAIVGKELRPDNIWENVELPRLMENPNVTRIISIDPKTGIETVIFER